MPDEAPPRGWPTGFAATERDRSALLVLASLRGITPRRLHALAWRTGSAAACLSAVRSGPVASAADRELARRVDPADVWSRVASCGARLVVPGSPEYVPLLEDLPDPPAALFVAGRSLVPRTPAVAVVGARRPSALGADVAHAFGSRLAAAGACVVSGAAAGIDRASHEGALDAGGPSVAVLGCGIDRVQRSTRTLLDRLVVAGAVVGEYPPGTTAERWHFPARNRLVAALADGVIVVEGGERSGSLITADHALALGREIFAVPGPVTSPLSAAPHGLIRDGATLVRSADDVIDELGLPASPATPHVGLEGTELAVYRAVTAPTLVEAIASATRLPLPKVAAALTALEIRGLVRSVAGRVERRAR
jgi:DNA processing protein